MLTLLFIVCMFWIFGRLLFAGIRAAWGISKIFLTVVLFPLVLIVMVIGGLLYIALPILLVAGVVSVVCRNDLF